MGARGEAGPRRGPSNRTFEVLKWQMSDWRPRVKRRTSNRTFEVLKSYSAPRMAHSHSPASNRTFEVLKCRLTLDARPLRAPSNRTFEVLRTCLASVSEDRLQQKSVGQRLMKGMGQLHKTAAER